MEKKSPFNSDFEKYVRQALQKTDGEPDDNTWANIAARQKGSNLRLRIRYYGPRAALFMVALFLFFAGWTYFSGETQPEIRKPDAPQQNMPAPMPQAAVSVPPASEISAKKTPEAPAAAGRRNSVPATTVRFLAEEGLRYENPATGTAVYIPAHALRQAGGKLVSGEVEFQLREYRSMADFMASGIPMHYSDERGDYCFNSGGMFDLRVNQHGEQLQMVPGQACDVHFTSTHKLTQPSLYYFDESCGAWKYQPDPAFTNEDRPTVVAEKTAVLDNRGLQVDCLPMETETSRQQWALPNDNEAAVWMQEAVQTGYDYAFGKKTLPGWFRKHPDWTNDQLLGGMERSAIRLKRHKDADDMFFPEDMNNAFTELKAFKDCYFIIDNGLGSKKSFTNEEFDSYWERFSVVQVMGATCYVSFFGKQGLLQFYATLIGSTENPSFDAGKVLAEYTRLRNERQQNFEKQANAWRHFLYMAQAFQSPEEWCMDASSWFDYFEANMPLMRKRYAELKEQGIIEKAEIALNTWTNWRKRVRDVLLDNYKNKRSLDRAMPKEGLTYALRVSNFGTYNCDQIFNIFGNGQETIYVLADFKTSDGRRIVPRSVSVMERNTRLFFTLPKTERMINAPGRKLDIIVTDASGRYYRLPGAKYASLDLKDQRSCTFTMEDVTEKTQTPREWANLLEI